MKKPVVVMSAALFLAGMLSVEARDQDAGGVFSLKVYGGVDALEGGDLNSGQKGWADFYAAVFGLLSYAPSGRVQPVRMGGNVGGEALYRFSSSLGMGLGVGFLQASRTSDLTFTPAAPGLSVLNYEAKTGMSAVPVTISLYYFLPAKGRISIGAHAGLGPYLARGTASQRLADGAGNWTLNEYRVRGGGLGFHGGLGGEYAFGRRLALFAEVRGRLAAFANFKGEVNLSDSSGWSDAFRGLLWTERVDLGFLGSWEIFEISDDRPSGSGISDVRRTRVDFSGVSLVLGMIYRL